MMSGFVAISLSHGQDRFIDPLKASGEFFQIAQQVFFQLVFVRLPLFWRLEHPAPRVPAITGLAIVLKNRGIA